MKKFYISLAVIGIVAGYIAKSDFWLEDERDVYFPITREQLKVRKPSATDLADWSHNHKQTFDVIKKRLATQYPEKSATSSKAYDREVKARLGLLHAMSVYWGAPAAQLEIDTAVVKNFFAELAKSKNENLMIRRQAYKNWVAFQRNYTLEESQRLASLASHSDENLLQSLTENAQ